MSVLQDKTLEERKEKMTSVLLTRLLGRKRNLMSILENEILTPSTRKELEGKLDSADSDIEVVMATELVMP